MSMGRLRLREVKQLTQNPKSRWQKEDWKAGPPDSSVHDLSYDLTFNLLERLIPPKCFGRKLDNAIIHVTSLLGWSVFFKSSCKQGVPRMVQNSPKGWVSTRMNRADWNRRLV